VNCTKSTQFAPKFVYLRSKIGKFSGEGHSVTLLRWRSREHPSPLHTPHLLALEFGVPRVIILENDAWVNTASEVAVVMVTGSVDIATITVGPPVAVSKT